MSSVAEKCEEMKKIQRFYQPHYDSISQSNQSALDYNWCEVRLWLQLVVIIIRIIIVSDLEPAGKSLWGPFFLNPNKKLNNKSFSLRPDQVVLSSTRGKNELTSRAAVIKSLQQLAPSSSCLHISSRCRWKEPPPTFAACSNTSANCPLLFSFSFSSSSSPPPGPNTNRKGRVA